MSDITNEWRELRSKLGDLICHIDGMNESIESKMKKLQEKEEQQADLQAQIDEEYRKGLKDLYEALHIIAAEDGMSASDLKDAFGTCSICDIVLGFTSEEIIGKALEWKTKQKKEEQELHVGDEIITDNGLIGIITDVCDGTVWLSYRLTPATRGLDFCWAYNAKCKKTGRHFDSIPFDYNPEKEEETNK